MGKKNKETGKPEQEVKEEQVTEEPVTEEQAEEKEAKPAEPEKSELDLAKEEIAALNDNYRRSLAEFDNYRKRTDKEKAARFDMGVKSVVEKLLPIVDNFERGLATIDGDKDAFAEGMEKTYKQLLDMLSSLGVTPIEAVGQKFNPDLHNAIMHIEDENEPENTIVEEFQKGYKLGDTVVRYSMVKVAN
ncbi:MAG: nucleotide exchange factor GrpE [Lachnospiraceae bacterium]|nr:nucleotide exchange factor GrpE [Candidatus Minthocola equi]